MAVTERHARIALACALALVTLVFAFGQADFVASDPLWYADIAHQIATDSSKVFSPADLHPFVMRIGLTVPLSLIYRVFGVSTFTSNLPSLLATLGLVVIVFAAAPTPRAKLFALLFCVCCVPLLQHLVLLNIDLPSAVLMAASVLCLSRRDEPRGSRWLAGGMIAMFAAFLVKETAVWCAVVWGYAIVVDLRATSLPATARRYAAAIGLGAVLGIAYLALCAQLWGSAFARFQGIDALTYEHTWAMHGRSSGEWLARLTWQVPWAIVKMFKAMLIPVVLAPWLVTGRERIWWFATAAFALLYWFGSSSMSSYAPLPISPRMILPVLPPVIVVAAIAMDRALERVTPASRFGRWRVPAAAVICLAVAAPGVRTMIGQVLRARPEQAAFAALRSEVSDPRREVTLVCMGPRCAAITNFYFGLEPRPNLHVVIAGEWAKAPWRADTVRVLTNDTRAGEAGDSVDALGLRAIVKSKHVNLYDAGDGHALWQALQ